MSLKDRKRSVNLYLGFRAWLRWWFVERKSGDDWVSACKNVVVAGVRCAG